MATLATLPSAEMSRDVSRCLQKSPIVSRIILPGRLTILTLAE